MHHPPRSAHRQGVTPPIEVCSYCILAGSPWHQPKVLKIDGELGRSQLSLNLAALAAGSSPALCIAALQQLGRATQHGTYRTSGNSSLSAPGRTSRYALLRCCAVTFDPPPPPAIVSLQLELAAAEESAINHRSGQRLPTEAARALDEPPLQPR